MEGTLYDHYMYLNLWGNKQKKCKIGGKRKTSLPSVNQPRPSKSLRFAAFSLLPSHRSQSLHALKNLTLLPPSLSCYCEDDMTDLLTAMTRKSDNVR